jgi:hypothetical protein
MNAAWRLPAEHVEAPMPKPVMVVDLDKERVEEGVESPNNFTDPSFITHTVGAPPAAHVIASLPS